MPESRLKELNRKARKKAGDFQLKRDIDSLVTDLQTMAVKAQKKKSRAPTIPVFLDAAMVPVNSILDRISEDVMMGWL